MYAILYQIDHEAARIASGNREINPDAEIHCVLQKHGFTWQQGGLYFADERVNAVKCILAAMDVARSLPWFAESVRDFRMFRIEEQNDLMPAVQQAAQ